MSAEKLPAVASEYVSTLKEEGTAFFDASIDRSDFGVADSLRYQVLTGVLNERYDQCIEKLKGYLDDESPYPNFKEKITRYINHCIDLIYAIKAKRSFPGFNSLTRAKQQELREKFKDHFKELKDTLKRIEKIKRDLQVQDVRSTIYVVKALTIAGTAITILAFWLDIMNGLAKTTWVVFEDVLIKIADSLLSLIGFWFANILVNAFKNGHKDATS